MINFGMKIKFSWIYKMLTDEENKHETFATIRDFIFCPLLEEKKIQSAAVPKRWHQRFSNIRHLLQKAEFSPKKIADILGDVENIIIYKYDTISCDSAEEVKIFLQLGKCLSGVKINKRLRMEEANFSCDDFQAAQKFMRPEDIKKVSEWANREGFCLCEYLKPYKKYQKVEGVDDNMRYQFHYPKVVGVKCAKILC